MNNLRFLSINNDPNSKNKTQRVSSDTPTQTHKKAHFYTSRILYEVKLFTRYCFGWSNQEEMRRARHVARMGQRIGAYRGLVVTS